MTYDNQATHSTKKANAKVVTWESPIFNNLTSWLIGTKGSIHQTSSDCQHQGNDMKFFMRLGLQKPRTDQHGSIGIAILYHRPKMLVVEKGGVEVAKLPRKFWGWDSDDFNLSHMHQFRWMCCYSWSSGYHFFGQLKQQSKIALTRSSLHRSLFRWNASVQTL